MDDRDRTTKWRDRPARGVVAFLGAIALVALVAVACRPGSGPPDPDAGGETLAPGEVVEGPRGIAVGAPDGALDDAVDLLIEVVNPADLLPLGSDVEILGTLFRLSSDERVRVTGDVPLLIGLPEEGDAADASIAVLAPAVGHGDAGFDDAVWAWDLVDPVRDASTGRALLPIYNLSTNADGIVVGLVRETGAAPATASDAAQSAELAPQAEVVGRFGALCSPTFAAGHCTPAEEEAAARAGDDFYQAMVVDRGFALPEIQPLRFGVVSTLYPLAFSFSTRRAAHRIDLTPDGRAGCKNDWEGRARYVAPLRRVYICLPDEAVNNMTQERQDVVNHEVFHGIQYAYPAFWEATGFARAFYWPMVEGGANAATFSRDAMVTDGSDAFHPIDVPLVKTQRFGTRGEDYDAQSFWVFVGRRQGVGVTYFQRLFAWGFRAPVVDAGFRDLFGDDYGVGEAYWDWAKTVAFEAGVAGGDLGLNDACVLDENFIDGEIPRVTFDPGSGIFDYGEFATQLRPLSARVFQIDLLSGNYVADVAIDIPNVNVRVKFYEAYESPTTDCQGVPDGSTYTTGVGTTVADGAKTIYALVAYVGLDGEPIVFTEPNEELLIDAYLPIEIVTPEDGDTFQEAAFVSFEAEVADSITGFTIDWESDLGDTITPTGPTTAQTGLLCPGTHRVTATLTTDLGDQVSDRVVIEVVNRPPTVEITSAPGEIAQGSTLTAQARAEDFVCTSPSRNTASPSAIQWFVDGTLVDSGSALAYPVSEAAGATLTVEARYADDGSPPETAASGPVSVEVVAPPPGGSDPVPVITNPSDGQQLLYPADVTFEGYANDADDGLDFASGADLTWYVDGSPVGNGKALLFNFEDEGVSPGPRTISLEAVDSDGDVGTTAIEVDVVPIQ